LVVSSNVDELIARAPFVFRGTVESLGEATTAAVAATDLTATVRVNEVVRAPQALRRYAGQLVTVELSTGEGARPGASFMFFTRPKLFADTLVVTELGRQPVAAEAAAAAAGAADARDALARVATAALTARLQAADAVIAGRVAVVRPSTLAAATPELQRPISEHDPQWSEAVVEVTSVVSGTVSPDTPVTVLFPASIDVAWYQAPKYAAGQSGVFLLHSEQVPVAAPEITGPTFTTLHPQDFHAAELEPQIRSLVERIYS
jgi:hypothetical protein